MSLEAWGLGFALFVLGLVFGSFGAAAAYRIPREIPLGLLKNLRSKCPHCETKISWYDNIPLLSYVLLKGLSRCCCKPISKSYPLVELSTALLFAASGGVVFYKLYHSTDTLNFWMEFIKTLYFVWALVVTAAVDFEFRIIPDRFSIGGFVVAALLSYWSPLVSWQESLLGALLGFGLFFMMSWFYEKIKKVEGLGFGDVKMMAWLGAWIGVWDIPSVILLASGVGVVAGLVIMRKSGQGMQTALPFGPFLALGAYLVWFWQVLNFQS